MKEREKFITCELDPLNDGVDQLTNVFSIQDTASLAEIQLSHFILAVMSTFFHKHSMH